MRQNPEIAGFFFANQTQKSKQEVSEEEKQAEKIIEQDKSKFMFNSFNYNIKQAQERGLNLKSGETKIKGKIGEDDDKSLKDQDFDSFSSSSDDQIEEILTEVKNKEFKINHNTRKGQ